MLVSSMYSRLTKHAAFVVLAAADQMSTGLICTRDHNWLMESLVVRHPLLRSPSYMKSVLPKLESWCMSGMHEYDQCR
jgi:hypothetical protein